MIELSTPKKAQTEVQEHEFTTMTLPREFTRITECKIDVQKPVGLNRRNKTAVDTDSEKGLVVNKGESLGKVEGEREGDKGAQQFTITIQVGPRGGKLCTL